jgi:hypothetical protein
MDRYEWATLAVANEAPAEFGLTALPRIVERSAAEGIGDAA